MTRLLNGEGVDQAALADAVEQWLAGSPDRTATRLAQDSGVHAPGICHVRRLERPGASLDWADGVCNRACGIERVECLAGRQRDEFAPQVEGSGGEHAHRHRRPLYEPRWIGVRPAAGALRPRQLVGGSSVNGRIRR